MSTLAGEPVRVSTVVRVHEQLAASVIEALPISHPVMGAVFSSDDHRPVALSRPGEGDGHLAGVGDDDDASPPLADHFTAPVVAAVVTMIVGVDLLTQAFPLNSVLTSRV